VTGLPTAPPLLLGAARDSDTSSHLCRACPSSRAPRSSVLDGGYGPCGCETRREGESEREKGSRADRAWSAAVGCCLRGGEPPPPE